MNGIRLLRSIAMIFTITKTSSWISRRVLRASLMPVPTQIAISPVSRATRR